MSGAGAPPLWRWLKDEARGLLGSRKVKWNFTKFLIGRDGKVVRRFGPSVTPEKIAGAIEGLL